MADSADAALDTVAAFLKALSDHAVEGDADRQKLTANTAMAWMRHLTVAGEHPETKDQGKRDFGGARRFVQRTMRDGHALHLKTTQQFRDTVWGFASELHAMVSADEHDDTHLRSALESLQGASTRGNADELHRATIALSRELFQVLEERRERQAKNALSAANKLPELLELMQNADGIKLDRTTGLLAFESLVDTAEKVHVLSSLARAPVSATVLSLNAENLRGDPLENLMSAVAPAVSRAFICRTDIVGRQSNDTFAVVSAGCDVTAAERASQRAIAAVAQVLKERGVSNDVRVRVSALSSPVHESLRRP